MTAYGPQENALKEKKEKFWEFIEKEVNHFMKINDCEIKVLEIN